ncbi:MAG: RAMP superfamily CRISPR-associated protein [Methanothrix sp.]|nr:RAMP superfamily CRISPR-associated protein [Methanothrix sp.]
MTHYPNPFDFVPFPSTPILRAEEQFNALGEKVSGYLELEIKALTPVHIMGKVEANPYRSSMYQQDGRPCIPASSIRGCLRSFTEALTGGWVTQANPKYEKVYGGAQRNKGRHVGFRTFEDYRSNRSSVHNRVSPPAVNSSFKPMSGGEKLDVASYLFGIVAEGKQEVQAKKSKLWVDDAFLAPTSITSEGCWMPDIALGSAFMGGAKPSASNWWYFQPAEVWERNLPRSAPVAEFIGEHFRGRKFYYHQDPARCISEYDPKTGKWNYPNNAFHPLQLECMASEKKTLPFRIYLDRVPQPLFRLLVNILLPGEHIRHKLGYAKAYGYGSIEFILKSAKLRNAGLGIPNVLEPINVPNENLTNESLAKLGFADLIDQEALACLARILGWPDEDLLFMYPQYREHEFKQPIQYANFRRIMLGASMPARAPVDVRLPHRGRTIANLLWTLKHPIDFRLYQENAIGWHKIVKRTP